MRRMSVTLLRKCTGMIALLSIIMSIMGLSGCGQANAILGTWASEDGDEVLQFEDDGTCSVPFTYSAAWWESCDRYALQDDGTLVLSSSQGNIDSREYNQTDSKEEAEESSGFYYISANELVINTDTYTKQ